MRAETFRIEIGGAEATDLYENVLGLQVELDDELAAMFTLRLAMANQPDGTWALVDDERLTAWQPVRISAGFDSSDGLIDGVITHIRPAFEADPSACTLEIRGMDRSVLMDRAQVRKDWPNRRDSDIASELFLAHELTPQVEDTPVSHDEAVSTVIQRETDIQFLARLALRNGFECYVEGTNGFFRPPQLTEPPQPVLAAHFGDDTTLRRFTVQVDPATPTEYTMAQLSRTTKEIVDVTAKSTTQPAFGANGSAALLKGGVPAAKTVLAQTVTTGEAELTALCQSGFDASEWFVRADGEVLANHYGHVLRPRRTVTVKGVGATHSGVYYVSHVSHEFSTDGYIQRFQARRNGLLPTGDEQFAGDTGLLGGLL
ncbi:phage protein D [Kibdelosporangium banguiense]|uniref:Phage protein D n=1 Tax=Kibdelosporangium banguiense TaxID=1365924 RepID=A0ABS4TQ60_9PSEU|nr:contractile injection system protein, VgrG/Pvc8 family [Kibdelosporangium banguiense]MBP2326538.1 phage protein D [Kibdelosporangium banguiense]